MSTPNDSVLEALAKLLEEHGWKVERPGTEPAEPEPKCRHINFHTWRSASRPDITVWQCTDCGERGEVQRNRIV